MLLSLSAFQLFGDSINTAEAAAVDIDSFCPRMVHQVFENYVPAGKLYGSQTQLKTFRLEKCNNDMVMLD